MCSTFVSDAAPVEVSVPSVVNSTKRWRPVLRTPSLAGTLHLVGVVHRRRVDVVPVLYQKPKKKT